MDTDVAEILPETKEEGGGWTERVPRVVGIFGDHPRHKWYANEIHKRFGLYGILSQYRGPMLLGSAPNGTGAHDSDLFRRHFDNRLAKEHEYFGAVEWPADLDHFCGWDGLEGLNRDGGWHIRNWEPDIVIIFGTGMIRDDLMASLPPSTLNTHLGLSPRYKGAATLFWPFYMLEPQWAGVTFHYITDKPDAGKIVHQCTPQLEYGDTIHDVACKAVVQGLEDVIHLILSWPDWSRVTQRSTGKLWLVSDFKPQHLRMIYDVYEDNLVDHYLDGKVKNKPVKLIRSF